MTVRQPLPRLWLVSDARNDAGLEQALQHLPRGSGFIYRHYHLAGPERRARFAVLKRIAKVRGHIVVLSGTAREARRWGADAAYGDATRLAPGPRLPRLITAHSLRELRQVGRADAALLSPVFATRSHPAAQPLGPLRFRRIAAQSAIPVIALGGMTLRTALRLKGFTWAAIDGLIAKDS